MPEAPRVLFGIGQRRELPRVLRSLRPERLLLVCGPHCFDACGVSRLLAPLGAEIDIARFHRFTPNPTLEAVERGIETLERSAADLVVGIGGGSALDLAKAIATLADQVEPPLAYLTRGARLAPRRRRLVLAPTTAGSGSEATPFSVVYVDGRKHSLDHPTLAADLALVDPLLCRSLPEHLAASSGLDALSQGVESLWSVRSTPTSRRWAAEAVRLAVRFLVESVRRPSSRSRTGMCWAAHLAGRAIAISRTTAPHAVSYPLTQGHGLAHGHACGLLLPGFLRFNAAVRSDDVADPRGAAFVRRQIARITGWLGARTPEGAARRVEALIDRLGLPRRLREAGLARTDLPALAATFDPIRAANNPRRVDGPQVLHLLGEAY